MKPPKTFDKLFRAHFDDACDVARREGVPASDAEDVAQESFLELAKLQPKHPDAPPHRLLGSITRNRARNHRRTDRRRKPVPHIDVKAPLTPEEEMRQGEGRAVMTRMIRELPKDLRRVYVMADIEGTPLDEIAGKLQIPLGTVKSRLHTARTAIDATLERLARNNELPAVLVPLVLGSKSPAWMKKIAGLLRPATIGVAAFFLVPSFDGVLSARPPAETILAAADDTPAGRNGEHAEVAAAVSTGSETPVTQIDSSRAGAMPVEHVAPPQARSAPPGLKPPDAPAPDRRALELMSLEDIHQALAAGDVGRAGRALERFDARFPQPQMSRERRRLAARIQEAATQTALAANAR